MSIEFRSECGNLDPKQRTAVEEAITSGDGYVIVRQEGDQVGLLRKEKEGADGEDVTLEFEQGGIYLAFHAASRTERTNLIGTIDATARSLGLASQFEEL